MAARHARNLSDVLNIDLLTETLYSPTGHQSFDITNQKTHIDTSLINRVVPMKKRKLSKYQNKNGILKGSYALVTKSIEMNDDN